MSVSDTFRISNELVPVNLWFSQFYIIAAVFKGSPAF